MVFDNELPTWVEDVGIAVDLWCEERRIRDRFVRMLGKWGGLVVREANRAGRGRSKPPLGFDSDAGVLPRRSMNRCEKYALLAAIRNTVCRRQPLTAWGKARGKHLRTDSGRVLAAVAFEALRGEVPHLTPRDHKRVVEALNEVANDLKRSRPRILLPEAPPRSQVQSVSAIDARRQTFVRASVAIHAPKTEARRDDDVAPPQGQEWTLAQASRETGAPTWALTRAARKPEGSPGHIPTRCEGSNRYVTREHAKAFAANYDARRERRVVGSGTAEGRKAIADLKKTQKFKPRAPRRKSS